MFLAFVLAIPIIVGLGGLLGYRVNLTPSEPLGVWRIRPLERPAARGDLVFVCPPQVKSMEIARQRGYLRAGLCPGGYAPLIKTIVALPGQHVQIGRNVTIDGIPVLSSTLSSKDGDGRRLTPFSGGSVRSGNVFLHSGFRGSFDSRYFGPVSASGILGLAEEIITYAP